MRRLVRRVFPLCLVAGVAAMGATQPPQVSARKDKAANISAPRAVLAPDKGKFRIVMDGQVVGSEEFEISPSGETWMARGSTTAHATAGGDIKATGQLKLAADGTPIRYDWSAQAQKKASGGVDFANGTAKSAIGLSGAAPVTRDFTFLSPRIAVLDNNLYYQYSVLAQIYDWKTGGKQDFPVLIPQDMTPGSISVESLGQQQVEATKYETLRVSSPDLEILLYLDANHRMMRLDVPSSKVMIVRE
jgi:hypothetical protein